MQSNSEAFGAVKITFNVGENPAQFHRDPFFGLANLVIALAWQRRRCGRSRMADTRLRSTRSARDGSAVFGRTATPSKSTVQRSPPAGASDDIRTATCSLCGHSGTVKSMAVLTDEQVDAALPDLDGWKRTDGALRRSIKFPSFLAGIDAVRRVAEHAESKDHHPDIDIRWRTVTFALVTHSEGGITKNDIDMARDIDGIVAD
jgi:4a-hydroxytetrahydrobiopterin dehydratase